MDLRHAIIRAGVVVALLSSVTAGAAQRRGASEAEIKAAYLAKLGSFFDFPRVRDPKAFHVCVSGRETIGRVLPREAANLTVDSRPVRPRQISDMRDARACDVLFIGATSTDTLVETLAAVDGAGVLTIGDHPEFTRRGGMVRLVTTADKAVRFEVNLDPIREAGLEVSSELLRSAVDILGTR